MLDRVELRRVRRQEYQRRAGGRNKLCRVRRGMKRRIVHHHEMLGCQPRTQPGLEPGVEDLRIAGALEQQRFLQAPVDPGGQQRGARSAMPGDQALHAVPLRGVPIPPHGRRRKPTLIDRDGPFAATKKPLPQAQKLFPSLRIAALYIRVFFLWVICKRCSAFQMQYRETWKCRARSAWV
jgi:hypothetical protein